MKGAYGFPINYFPLWHIGTKLGIKDFERFIKRSEQVLEIGSGAGFYSLYCAKKDKEVTSLDISKSSLEKLKDTAEQMDVSLHTVQGSCYSLPFPDESYDTIIAAHIIEHLDKPKKMLLEINRVLKKKGRLLLSCPSIFQKSRISRILGIEISPEDHVVEGYSRKQLESFLPKGMKITKEYYQAKFIERTIGDVQGLLAKSIGIKANPLGGYKKKRNKESSLLKIAYVFKEAAFIPLTWLLRLESKFQRKGGWIVLEIRK